MGEVFASKREFLKDFFPAEKLGQLEAIKLPVATFDQMPEALQLTTVRMALGFDTPQDVVQVLFAIVFPKKTEKNPDSASIDIDVNIPDTTEPGKPKGIPTMAGLGTLADIANQTYWSAPAALKAAEALRVIGFTASRLDEVVAQLLTDGNTADIEDPDLNDDAQNYTLQKATDSGSFTTSAGKVIEILPQKLRRQSVDTLINWLENLGPFDDFVFGLAAYADASERSDFLESLNIVGDQAVHAPTPKRLRQMALAALEKLCEFSNQGVAAQAVRKVAHEIDFLAERLLMNPAAINAMGFAVDSRNPFMSFAMGLQRKKISNSVRDAALYSEALYQLIQALIKYAQGPQNTEDLLPLMPLVQAYLTHSQAFGKHHVRDSKPGISNLGGALRVSMSVTVGGVTVQTSVTLETGPKVFLYQTEPWAAPTLGVQQAFSETTGIMMRWFQGQGGVSQKATGILISYLPSGAEYLINQLDFGGSSQQLSVHLVKKFGDAGVLAEFHKYLQPKGEYVRALAPVLIRMIKDMPEEERPKLEQLAYFYTNYKPAF